MTTSILETLAGSLRGAPLDALAAQVGASPDQVKLAVNAGLPALLGALEKQSASPDGAQALASAVDKDHDGSLLDSLGGLLGGAGAGTGVGGLLEMAGTMLGAASGPGSARTTNGAGILGHLLGGRQGAVEQGMAKASGLDMGTVGQILTFLAPLLMGSLGKAKSSGGLDAGGLGELIGREAAQVGGSASGGGALGGLLGGLLDKDDDGSVADDLAMMAGKKILGDLFG
ncbi:MAG: DUF937 domain-containing protein [Myxococcota bacterium]